MPSVEVRSRLVDALRLDLVGPSDAVGDPNEFLPQAPSSWYLAGFLVPTEAVQTQGVDESSTDEVDEASDGSGLDDDVTPEPAAARQRYLPSSIGLSVLVPNKTGHLGVKVSWGEYSRRTEGPETWQRTPRSDAVTIDLAKATAQSKGINAPGSQGLQVAYLARRVGNLDSDAALPSDAHGVSVFVVSRCT